MDLLGQLLVTALAALLGAWGGARAALARFKEERAFDRRLKWYHETIRALWGARSTIKTWAVHFEQKGLEEGEPLPPESVREILEEIGKAVGLTIEGRMFARQVSFTEMRQAGDRLMELQQPDRQSSETFPETLKGAARIFGETAEKLADHGREHLQFQELERSEVSMGARLKAAVRALQGEVPSSLR